MKPQRTLRRRYLTPKQKELNLKIQVADNFERMGAPLIMAALMRPGGSVETFEARDVAKASALVYDIFDRVTRIASLARRGLEPNFFYKPEDVKTVEPLTVTLKGPSQMENVK